MDLSRDGLGFAIHPLIHHELGVGVYLLAGAPLHNIELGCRLRAVVVHLTIIEHHLLWLTVIVIIVVVVAIVVVVVVAHLPLPTAAQRRPPLVVVAVVVGMLVDMDSVNTLYGLPRRFFRSTTATKPWPRLGCSTAVPRLSLASTATLPSTATWPNLHTYERWMHHSSTARRP